MESVYIEREIPQQTRLCGARSGSPQLYFLTVVTVHSIVCLLQTGGQYFEEEGSHLGVPPLYLSQVEYAQYCYDATWTLAYALNQTINGRYTWCSYSQEFIFTKAIQLEVLSA